MTTKSKCNQCQKSSGIGFLPRSPSTRLTAINRVTVTGVEKLSYISGVQKCGEASVSQNQ